MVLKFALKSYLLPMAVTGLSKLPLLIWRVIAITMLTFQVDSIFSMKRPYDLVAFMQQEQRAEVLNQLKEEMSSKRFDETVDHVVEQTTAFDQVSFATNQMLVGPCGKRWSNHSPSFFQ